MATQVEYLQVSEISQALKTSQLEYAYEHSLREGDRIYEEERVRDLRVQILLLEDENDTLREQLDDSNVEVENLEDDLFDGEPGSEREVQRRVYKLRKSLVGTRRYVLPMREVVSTIVHRAHDLHAAPELEPYYADLSDHVTRAAEWTESVRDMLVSIFETSLTLADSRLNTIMKQLTAWAAIIAVPTAITGFYGQNVPYPGFSKEWGFAMSAGICVVAMLVLYLSFKRRDWL